MDVKWFTSVHQGIPYTHRLIGRDPDFVTEVASVTGARDLNRHARDSAFSDTEVFEIRDIGVCKKTLQESAGSWSLQSECRDTF